MAAEYASLLEEKRINDARLNALRREKGEHFDENEFTDKESFGELEKELEAFVKFYEERWKITKKRIRKKLLNYQSLKGQKGQNKKP